MPSKTTTSWQRGAKLVKNTQVTNQYLEHIRDVHDPSMHIKTIEDELRGTMGKALGKQGDKILMSLRLMKEQKELYDSLMDSILAPSLQEKESNESADNITASGMNESKDSIGPNMNKVTIRKICEAVDKYNTYRKDCVHARWELIVHRQAVGFIVNNHKFVHEKFPIPDALELPDAISEADKDSSRYESSNVAGESIRNDLPKKQFGDQLGWWERIGRWK